MSVNGFDGVFDRIVAQTLGESAPDSIGDEIDLLSAGVTSLELIKLIMRLEDELGILWPVEQLAEYEKFARVGELRLACRDLVSALPQA